MDLINSDSVNDDIAINKQLEEIANKLSDKEIEETYKRSEAFALIPILKLIYHTTGIDYGKDFKLKCPLSSSKSTNIPTGEVEINFENNPFSIYKIYLDFVDSTYDLNESLKFANLLSPGINNIMDEPNEEKKNQLIQIITFLVHSAKLVFDSIKSKYSEILEYNISLDNNTSIYLDHEKPLRIGIKIARKEIKTAN